MSDEIRKCSNPREPKGPGDSWRECGSCYECMANMLDAANDEIARLREEDRKLLAYVDRLRAELAEKDRVMRDYRNAEIAQLREQINEQERFTVRREASHHADVARLRAELAEKERALRACHDMAVEHIPAMADVLSDEHVEDDTDHELCNLCGNYWPAGEPEHHDEKCGLAALASGGEQGQGEDRGEDVPGVGGHTGQRFDSAPLRSSPDSLVCRWHKNDWGYWITQCGEEGVKMPEDGICSCTMPITTDREEG